MRTGALYGLLRGRWVSPQRGLPAHEALRVATRTPPRHNLYWNLPQNHLLFSGVPSTAGPNPPGFRGRPQPVRKPPRQARNVYCHPWSFGGHCQLSGLYPLARSFPRRSSLPRPAAADEADALNQSRKHFTKVSPLLLLDLEYFHKYLDRYFPKEQMPKGLLVYSPTK